MVLLSLILGSFLNVCIYRIPRNESIAFPGSHCTTCDTQLKALDLIPIISYIMYKGKCRYCGENISPRYPLIEGLNALLYVLIYLVIGLTPYSITLMLLSSVLIVITMIDIDHQIIPDSLNIAIILIGILQIALKSGPNMTSRIIGLLIGGGFFLLIAIVTAGNMGGGDIKLMGALGFLFGWQKILVITLLSFIIGSIISLTLLATKKATKKDPIPFGPFIAISTYVALICGNRLITYYIHSFT